MPDEIATPDKDTLVETQATFNNTRDELTDPATVSVTWKAPSGALTTWTYGVDVQLERLSLGVFTAQKILNEEGLWKVKWHGVGIASRVVRITVIEPDF